MDFTEIVKQGGIAGVALILGLLYRQERAERKEYQGKYEASLEQRLKDSKTREDRFSNRMLGMSQGIKKLSDKIVISKKENL